MQAEDRLSRVWYWKGAAWYQKEVEIPQDWAGKNVKLLLERTKDTYVWFDDVGCGYENTLSAPQYFDLSKAIKPGSHKITVLVNNAKLPPVGPSHAVDERTQTNWNGIVGRIELQVSPDFNDMPKFTGVTRARNYEIFRERLKDANRPG